MRVEPRDVANCTLALARRPDRLFDSLNDTAASLVDEYLNEESAAPFVRDPGWIETQNLEAFVKSNRIDDRNIDAKAPSFRQSINIQIASLNNSFGSEPSPRDRYREALGV